MQYYGTAFKVPTIGKWFVVVSGPQMVDDLRKATDETVSFREALVDVLKVLLSNVKLILTSDPVGYSNRLHTRP